MINLVVGIWPELALVGTACVLLLLSALRGDLARRVGPVLALLVLVATLVLQIREFGIPVEERTFTNSVLVGPLAQYIKILASAAGILFVLLAWPTHTTSFPRGSKGAGNGSLAVGSETGEFYALMLLSLAGLMLSAGANNIILLFLGLELASIPTYIMVSISRPLPQAQEAGVKYFFLGALSAAVMLLGFSYLYGATGSIYLEGNGAVMPGIYEAFVAQANSGSFTGLQTLAVVLLLAGFAFKMAAVPLHVYAADVYQGAATPMTAFLSVVPKAAGLIAMLKVLIAVGGPNLSLPSDILTLLAVVAVLTMTVGNVLALMQYNIKRTMAYSSIAHSGYMLAGVAAILAATGKPAVQIAALSGVLFYLATYALMNTGVFAVIQQLPARKRFGDDATPSDLIDRGSASADTFEDIAGHGKAHPILGVCLAVCALSLVGLPATAGFLGKLLLAKPLLDSGLTWLLVAMMINAAISAAYYLRLPAAMFFRPLPEGSSTTSPLRSFPASLTAVTCTLGVLALGTIMPLTSILSTSSEQAGGDKILFRNITTPSASATPSADTTIVR